MKQNEEQLNYDMRESIAPIDKYDTSLEESELRGIQHELEQTQASLEGDFAKFASEKITPELEEMFFDDKEAFLKEILKMQNNYWQERVGRKQARASELSENIARKKYTKEMDTFRANFEKETGADIDELLAFMNDYVPNKVRVELEKMPPREMFMTLLEMSKGSAPHEANQQEGGETQVSEPPKRIAGNPTPSASDSYNRDSLPTQRW